MKKQKRYYSKEFKLKAIELINNRESITAAAIELGIRPDMLGRWQREYDQSQSIAFTGAGNRRKGKEDTDLIRLRKELREVKLERDILKKAVSIFSKSDRTNMNL